MKMSSTLITIIWYPDKSLMDERPDRSPLQACVTLILHLFDYFA